jgi:hypothetical protein
MVIMVPELEALASSGPRVVAPWSEEECAIVGEYYPRGITAKRLSEYLNSKGYNRSVASVEHFIRRMELCHARKNVEA